MIPRLHSLSHVLCCDKEWVLLSVYVHWALLSVYVHCAACGNRHMNGSGLAVPSDCDVRCNFCDAACVVAGCSCILHCSDLEDGLTQL
jgi:hypothetical protein